MNVATKKNISQYLRNNRYLRFDEIEEIMHTVDDLTEYPEDKKGKERSEYRGREDVRPLVAMLTKNINIPIWMLLTLSTIMFCIGKYAVF